MDMDIKDGELGGDGLFDLDIKEGDLVLKVVHDSKGLDAELNVRVDSGYFIDKLAEKIPGQVDDAILQVLKAALKA